MGLKLKLKRIEKGFKQIELAEQIGISRYYLSGLERDKIKNPNIEVMKKISKVLEVSVQELFFDD
jgi:putative transcriptional regulator